MPGAENGGKKVRAINIFRVSRHGRRTKSGRAEMLRRRKKGAQPIKGLTYERGSPHQIFGQK